MKEYFSLKIVTAEKWYGNELELGGVQFVRVESQGFATDEKCDLCGTLKRLHGRPLDVEMLKTKSPICISTWIVFSSTDVDRYALYSEDAFRDKYAKLTSDIENSDSGFTTYFKRETGCLYYRICRSIASQWNKHGDHPLVSKYSDDPEFSHFGAYIGKLNTYINVVTPGSWIVESLEFGTRIVADREFKMRYTD